MQENLESKEKKEPKESDFKAPGELETGYTEESWKKPEKTMEEKGTTIDKVYQESEEPKASDFKAPGELETGYTEKSWKKPEKTMEEAREEARMEPTEGTREETRVKPVEEKIEEIREKARIETVEGVREETRTETGERVREEAREEKSEVYTKKKRLARSRTEKMLFGVCGGLGNYFGIDPTIVRLVFVLLTLLDGIGIVVYIILAIVMPKEEKVQMLPETRKSA